MNATPAAPSRPGRLRHRLDPPGLLPSDESLDSSGLSVSIATPAPSTSPRSVPAAFEQQVQAILLETPIRSRASVEIETMTRGAPKVTVRVDDDNPDHAKHEAVRVYRQTLALLKPSGGKEEEESPTDEVAG